MKPAHRDQCTLTPGSMNTLIGRIPEGEESANQTPESGSNSQAINDTLATTSAS